MESIIIAAIGGALGNLGSDTVKAGYRKLKELLLRKSGASGGAALENWEKKPESPAWKGALLEELEAAGADKDEEIIKAAQALLDAVKAQAGGIGMDIGTFKAAKLEVSDVVAEEKGIAVRMKEVDIEGTATFSKIGGSRPNQ